MAHFDVAFGHGELGFDLPDTCLRSWRRETRAVPPTSHYDQEQLAHDIEHAGTLLVVVNDGFRPTPTQQLLAPFQDALSHCDEVRLVVATGMHPGPDGEQIERLLGNVAHDYAVVVHDSTAEHADFGVLSDGTPLELNPLLNWPRHILLVGSVEPHFFAGFTGGAKQILPGLASKSCIEANHRHAVHPHCRALRLADNPVAMAIRETSLLFASRLFSIQAVEGPDGWETYGGGEPDTFQRAALRAGVLAQCLWEEKLDGLIAVVQSPLDRNLYQLQKGFENHLEAVKPGGFVLLVSACSEGVGNDFFGKLALQYPDWRRLPEWESQAYSLGLHKLYRTAAARQEHDLYLYSQLPAGVVRSVYLEPVEELQPWIDQNVNADLAIGVVNFAERHVSTVDRASRAEWSMEEQRYG